PRTTLENPTGNGLGRFKSYEFSGGISYGYQIDEHWAVGTGVRFIYSSLASGEVEGEKIEAGTSVGVDLAGMYKSDTFELFSNRQATVDAGINISNIGPGIKYTSHTDTVS